MRAAIRRAVAAILLTALGLLALADPEPARANFTDVQQAGGAFATATLQAPVFASCSNASGDVTITWRFTSAAVPGVDASAVSWSVSSGILTTVTNLLTPSSLSTTGPDATGLYSTTISAGLISQLVVASPFTIRAETGFQSWTAAGTNSAQGTSAGLFGAGSYSCTLQ